MARNSNTTAASTINAADVAQLRADAEAAAQAQAAQIEALTAQLAEQAAAAEAARAEAQAEVLTATRAARAAAKAKAAAEAEAAELRAAQRSRHPDVDVKATVVDEPSHPKAEFSYADAQAMLDEAELPSGTRILLSFLASIAIIGGAAYGATIWLPVAAAAAVAYTGWAFISYVVTILGVLLAAYTAFKSTRIISSFILTGSASELFGSATSSVSGWFRPSVSA